MERNERGWRRWWGAAAVAAVALAACSQPSSGREQFLDDLRSTYPEVSEADASDQFLVDAALDSCAPSGFSESTEAALREQGIDPTELQELALPLCPSR
jgi:hypothetical protein